MSDEITVAAQIQLANGDLDSFQISTGSLKFDQDTAAPVRVAGTQIIGFAAHEAVTITDLTTLGWCYFRNRDATNFVQIGVDVGATFYPLVRIEPGEIALFRMSQGITPYAQADTAAVILERVILDD